MSGTSCSKIHINLFPKNESRKYSFGDRMSFSHDKVIDSIFVSFHWILLLEEANSTFAAYTNEHLHVLPSCLTDIMTIHSNISSILLDIHITWRTFQCYVLLKMVRKNPYIWNFFYIWNFSGNYKFNTQKI